MQLFKIVALGLIECSSLFQPITFFTILNLGSLIIIVITAKALFSLRALFGAKQIHSYRRMASLIRTRFSDLYGTTSRHISEETLGTTVPR